MKCEIIFYIKRTYFDLDWCECSYSGAFANVLLHWLPWIFQGGYQFLWQTGNWFFLKHIYVILSVKWNVEGLCLVAYCISQQSCSGLSHVFFLSSSNFPSQAGINSIPQYLFLSGGAVLYTAEDSYFPMERGRCHCYQACSSYANHGELKPTDILAGVVFFIWDGVGFLPWKYRYVFISRSSFPMN